MRKSQGSLAGWLFADLTLVIAVVMLSSWTISQETTSTATVTLKEYNLLLSEKNKLEAELEALKTELMEIKNENEDLKTRLGAGEKGVKLEPVSIIISASERDSSQSIFDKIDKELGLQDIKKTQQFSFALIFGGTSESQSKEMLEMAKSRAKKIGERLQGIGSDDGWSQFSREKYVRAFHETGLPDGYFKIELYPSN